MFEQFFTQPKVLRRLKAFLDPTFPRLPSPSSRRAIQRAASGVICAPPITLEPGLPSRS
jgi:hypothetical protein